MFAVWGAAIVLDGGIFTAAVVLRPVDTGSDPTKVQTPGRFRYSADRPGESRLRDPTRHRPSDIGQWPDTTARGATVMSGESEMEKPTRAIHSVASRETLSTIARGYHGAEGGWLSIAEANVIGAPYVLQIGQRLRLPDVSIAHTTSRIRLSAPREVAADAETRAIAAFPANPPPDDAFQPAEQGLSLETPISESFGWSVVAKGLALYVLVAIASSLWATATLGRQANVNAMGRALIGAVGVGSGVAALLIGVASLGGAVLAHGTIVQCAFAATAGVGCGLAAYHGALRVGEGSATAVSVARSYAFASGITVVFVLYLSIAFGAFGRSAAMIRLPL